MQPEHRAMGVQSMLGDRLAEVAMIEQATRSMTGERGADHAAAARLQADSLHIEVGVGL